MYIVVQHSVSDPQAFGEISQSAQIPEHLTLHQVLPKGDGTQAVCLWEGPSVDAVRSFVEDGVGHVSDNAYFAVETANAVGLPG